MVVMYIVITNVLLRCFCISTAKLFLDICSHWVVHFFGIFPLYLLYVVSINNIIGLNKRCKRASRRQDGDYEIFGNELIVTKEHMMHLLHLLLLVFFFFL